MGGANCSNCNCNRDEKEHEIKLEDKYGDPKQKVLAAEQSFSMEEQQRLQMNDVVSALPPDQN